MILQDGDSVQDSDAGDKRGVTSSALWDSLKTCCLHMQRLDLATLCDRRDLEGESRVPLLMADRETSDTDTRLTVRAPRPHQPSA